ncbi:MAG: T9SS type A sorting domain-containing protein [Flavobacteriales bacterium]|nr:T9SS type A sorting domain-containing protein [Flavobacteriales bacterium]
MNQRYLLLSTLLVAGTCIAQSSRETRYALQHDDGTVQQAPPAAGTMRDGGDIIFSEDFSNGFAGNNGFGAWTTSGPNGDIWKRTTTGPRGAYTVVTQIIASTSVANGFALFASDSANCDWSSGTPVWPAAPVEWEGALESPVLDLSATPSVMLQWEQRLRWCCQAISPHAVEVSTDGGLTWPTTLEAAAGIATNNDPGTQTRSVMLTAAITADPSQVKFRFKHNPTGAAYHWQIDDVQLVELYSDDMKVEDGYLSQTGDGDEYGRIPADQFEATMLMGSNVTNNGAQPQTNVTVNIDVVGATPFNTSATLPSVDPGVTAPAEVDYTLPLLSNGIYEATFTVSADAPDQVTTNNTFQRNFEVTPNRYSVDGIGIHPAANQTLATLGTSSFTGATDGLILLNYYEVHNPLTVYGIEVALGNTTVAGGYVIASLRDTAAVFATPPAMTTVIAETDPVDITAANVTSGLAQVCFTSPVDLAPNGYFGSISLFSNAGASHIRVVDDLTVPQPGVTSAIYIPNDDVYSNGNAMAVRLITNPSGTACAVGINDREELNGVNIFPSITDGIVNVRTQKPGSYTIEVLDLLGQTVLTTRSNGSAVIDLGNQPEGMYMVRVSTEGVSTVQRVTLN